MQSLAKRRVQWQQHFPTGLEAPRSLKLSSSSSSPRAPSVTQSPAGFSSQIDEPQITTGILSLASSRHVPALWLSHYTNSSMEFQTSSCVTHLSSSSCYCSFLPDSFHHKFVISILLLFMPRSWMSRNTRLMTPASNSAFTAVHASFLSPACCPSCNACTSLHPFDIVINFPDDSIINPLRKRLNNQTFLSRQRLFDGKG